MPRAVSHFLKTLAFLSLWISAAASGFPGETNVVTQRFSFFYAVQYPAYFDDAPLIETFGGGLAGYEVRRNYNSETGEITRVELWKDSALVHAVDYTADGRSQIGTVTASGGKTFAATYAYPDDFHETLTAGSVVTTKTFTGDGTGRLASLGTSAGGENYSAVFGYGGGFNRKSLTLTAPGAAPLVWNYTFQNAANATGQLQSASSSAGSSFTYNHDAAGNRAGSAPNNANQYSISQVAGARTYTVSGKVAPGATVTIARAGGAAEAVAVAPDGSFSKSYAAPPGGENPASIPLIVEGTLAGAGDNGTDAVAAQERTVTLAPSSWASTYGAHGALASDWRWVYKWDSLGRLSGMETQAQAVAAGMPNRKLKFSYDEQGRRITKTVFHKGTGGAVERTVTTKFIYDGWRLLAEEINDTAAVGTISRQYTWGKDIAGSLEETGGVGGLLAIHQNGATRIPIYDANGNIIALADATSGKTLASWSRGPFGEPVSESGDTSLCPIGFATHYTDEETGLVYFGHRFYSPETGRWLSREPLGETESFDLYVYCHNDPVNGVDVLGLREKWMIENFIFGFDPIVIEHKPSEEERAARIRESEEISYVISLMGEISKGKVKEGIYPASDKQALLALMEENRKEYEISVQRQIEYERIIATSGTISAPERGITVGDAAQSIGAPTPSSFYADINNSFLIPSGVGGFVAKTSFRGLLSAMKARPLIQAAAMETRVEASVLRGIGANTTPFESMLSKGETFDFSTPANKAVFYSGPGQGLRATAFAERTGGMTIEMTAGGRALAADPAFHALSPAEQFKIWQSASTPFANGASGRINAFIRGALPERTFRSIEEPLLKQNSAVFRSTYWYRSTTFRLGS